MIGVIKMLRMVIKSSAISVLYMLIIKMYPFTGVPLTEENTLPLFVALTSIFLVGNLALRKLKEFAILNNTNSEFELKKE